MSDTILESNAVADDYFQQSRRPLASLLFVLPLLAVYELGVAILGPQAIINGADVWLRQLLLAVGVGSSLALPALIVVILLAWHHTTAQPWRVRSSVLGGMAIECAVLAVVLLSCVQIQVWSFDKLELPLARVVGGDVNVDVNANASGSAIVASSSLRTSFAHFVSYFGAGVYEETLFRLMLLPLCMAALRGAKFTPRTAVVIAVIVTSLLFSAAHHVGASGEPLDPFPLFRFTFRFAAGVLFCAVFLFRGFGIAVGAHAVYDVLAGWW
ncbi:MAG: CPBP family intramembrane glutamic endopeptidase [Pirellulales bacterium]